VRQTGLVDVMIDVGDEVVNRRADAAQRAGHALAGQQLVVEIRHFSRSSFFFAILPIMIRNLGINPPLSQVSNGNIPASDLLDPCQSSRLPTQDSQET